MKTIENVNISEKKLNQCIHPITKAKLFETVSALMNLSSLFTTHILKVSTRETFSICANFDQRATDFDLRASRF